jgi:outer membrane protein assembly factor BamB
MSPSVTNDDAVILGSKATAVFVLDRRSGQLLKEFSSAEEALLGFGESGPGEAEDEDKDEVEEGKELADGVLFVGRDDYTVLSIDMRTKQQLWNVSYSSMRPLSKASMMASSSRGKAGLPLPPQINGAALFLSW